MASHRDYVSLEGAVENAPLSLVDREGSECVVPGILVRLCDDPGRSIRDSLYQFRVSTRFAPPDARTITHEVEHFPRGNKCMEGMHELGDAGIPVPEMNIVQIDVGRPELLQGSLDVEVKRLRAGASVEDLLLDRVVPVLGGAGKLFTSRSGSSATANHSKLLALVAMKSWSRTPFDSAHSPMICSDDSSWLAKESPIRTRSGSDSRLCSLEVRSIDEVSTEVIVRVEELEAVFLVHRAHSALGPLVTNAHTPKADGRDADAGSGAELAVEAQLGLGERQGCEELRHRGAAFVDLV